MLSNKSSQHRTFINGVFGTSWFQAVTYLAEAAQQAEELYALQHAAELRSRALNLLYQLQPGDLVMTGTPAGVGPVQIGDQLRGCIEGIGSLEVRVA